jgi:hypothetical protein
MIIVCCLLIVLLIFTRRGKGPIWLFCISWLVCIFPTATGLITYSYFSPSEISFSAILSTYLACFLIGVLAYKYFFDRKRAAVTIVENYHSVLVYARVAWLAGLIGTICYILDFLLYKGSGLSDLSNLREVVVTAESSSFLLRLGSVSTWGCLYCFAFSLYYREQLSRSQFIFYALPVAGFFLTALLSAGRQAAMQILLFGLIIQLLRPEVNKNYKHNKGAWVLPLCIVLIMSLYMGYVAVLRNDGLVSFDKSVVLERLFDYNLSPDLETLLESFFSEFKQALTEALVYFSSPIPLFSKFLTIQSTDMRFGLLNFPFIARQIEPLTGVEVVSVMKENSDLMSSVGVIGVGWSTAISSYIGDFGQISAGMILFFQGFFTEHFWRKAKQNPRFSDVVIAAIFLMMIVYMPLLSVLSDTNIFLLFLFCFIAPCLRKCTFKNSP